jgi:hypothetical protein
MSNLTAKSTTNNCSHPVTNIVVLHAFAMVEVIGYKCANCNEIIKKIKQ